MLFVGGISPIIYPLPEITSLSTKYFILSKVCTDRGWGGYKIYPLVYLPIREIIHSLKLVDYFLVQADKPCKYHVFQKRRDNRDNDPYFLH